MAMSTGRSLSHLHRFTISFSSVARKAAFVHTQSAPRRWRNHSLAAMMPRPYSSSALSPFPEQPHGWDPLDESLLPAPTKIDSETIAILERQSLVDFANEEGVRTLEAAIRFADQLHLVDTEGVDPMTTVQESRTLTLREDEVTCGGDQSLREVLANAKNVYEDFYVAPPGNIPLESKDFEKKDEKKAKKKP